MPLTAERSIRSRERDGHSLSLEDLAIEAEVESEHLRRLIELALSPRGEA